jgi:hypothetical protein
VLIEERRSQFFAWSYIATAPTLNTPLAKLMGASGLFSNLDKELPSSVEPVEYSFAWRLLLWAGFNSNERVLLLFKDRKVERSLFLEGVECSERPPLPIGIEAESGLLR